MGHSSGGRTLSCKGLDNPAWQSILHGWCIHSLGYFPFQPVLHNWSINGRGMGCPVCGKVHMKDCMLLIGKSSLCDNSGFPLQPMIWRSMCCRECAVETSLNKTNFPFYLHWSHEVKLCAKPEAHGWDGESCYLPGARRLSAASCCFRISQFRRAITRTPTTNRRGMDG